MRPITYNTKQLEIILDYVVSLNGEHVTAAQINRHFKDKGLSIGRTTIYRRLDKLTKDGCLRRYITDGVSGSCYQYVNKSGEESCDSHWHLKCESCGELQHLDCETLEDIERHVLDEHAFQVNNAKTVLYGRCNSCLEAKQSPNAKQ